MTANGPGHVFVTRGRVEKLVCDAVIVPTDVAFSVMDWFWAAAGGATEVEVRPTSWPTGGAGRAADGSAVWFLDVGGQSTQSICAGLTTALQDVAVAGLSPRAGRSRPLIVMPLPGIGHGGSKPGEVIAAILTTITDAVSAPGAPDVNIVIKDARAYAAVMHIRRGAQRWPLHPDALVRARELGERARAGELALFAGAGVSQPAGRPGSR